MTTAITNRSTEHELFKILTEIGIARFVGRINSGVVDPDLAYKVLEDYLSEQKKRSFASRFTHAFLGREEPYTTR